MLIFRGVIQNLAVQNLIFQNFHPEKKPRLQLQALERFWGV